MKTEHHEQRVDFDSGYIVAKRTDTAEYQELEIAEYTDSGALYRKQRILYNIQYDYTRTQDWQGETMTADDIDGMDHYGHLQWEYGSYPPEGWINPYPGNHEPVKKEGADTWRTEGISFCVFFGWLKITAMANMYIREELDEYHRERMANLITEPEKLNQWIIEKYQEEQAERARHPVKFDPIAAAKKRFKAIRKHSKKIGVNIPYDPFFMD